MNKQEIIKTIEEIGYKEHTSNTFLTNHKTNTFFKLYSEDIEFSLFIWFDDLDRIRETTLRANAIIDRYYGFTHSIKIDTSEYVKNREYAIKFAENKLLEKIKDEKNRRLLYKKMYNLNFCSLCDNVFSKRINLFDIDIKTEERIFILSVKSHLKPNINTSSTYELTDKNIEKLDGLINLNIKEIEMRVKNDNTINRTRGFEVVDDKFRKHPDVDIELPKRGDSRSAGYDIKTPVRIELKPGEKKLVFTDLKAYMLDDEVLELHIRSSIGVKKGVILSNVTGIIDASYYNNKNNNGNIGIPLWNTSDKTVVFEEQERICQGVFKKYLTVDDDECMKSERTGGFGSSGRN